MSVSLHWGHKLFTLGVHRLLVTSPDWGSEKYSLLSKYGHDDDHMHCMGCVLFVFKIFLPWQPQVAICVSCYGCMKIWKAIEKEGDKVGLKPFLGLPYTISPHPTPQLFRAEFISHPIRRCIFGTTDSFIQCSVNEYFTTITFFNFSKFELHLKYV